MEGVRKTEKAGEEAPEKVQEENDARWQEYGKLRRMERKLQKKILGDPGQRPSSPEPMMHATIPGSNLTEQWGTDVPCRTQDGGRCRSWLEDRPVGPVMQNQWTVAPGRRKEHQESGAARPNPPPPPPSSWGSSSVVSKATAENLSSGIEELMSQQAQMVEATLWLIAAVS